MVDLNRTIERSRELDADILFEAHKGLEAFDLTLVIPCYNEESHIENSVKELLFSMSNTTLSYEIIFIDDCSLDGTRSKLIELKKLNDRITVIFNDKNIGRGATVTKGFRLSKAIVVGFIDIDLSTQALYVPYLTNLILNDVADVATCHRSYKIQMSVFHRVAIRYFLSYGYRNISRWYLGHKLADTETGCKFFLRSKVTSLLDKVIDTNWFWDTEIMVLAERSGYRIREVFSIFVRRPEKPSTVKITRDVARYISCLLKFKSRLNEH
ncbi:glycosyltransferase [Polynucleobacter sp. AP-Jannik-300A-C4]|uniref:glycosyltransferase n=1 Tax=Polynucleobacter sp. AP-Jannik-300A-C4 TaxID=2576928 RepID=UPI001BFE9D5C|nr:glycosyltransferase [Polynucleobacter sp. AP-Jannik-300A-C4]QWE22949.1 glycosyltransferase [Polynucleobacter sp. AP-Jannik-300A-C4]